MTGRPFSCFVVGSGGVALRCTELLRLAGHHILGVYSFDGALSGLGNSHGIRHASSQRQFEESLHCQAYDYLFSVNNPWIIPPSVLALACKSTINFHDSPLPKYAGLHATSWALMNGETRHATSWHEAIAIRCGDNTLSYAELEFSGNQLADWEICLQGKTVNFYQGYGPTEATITCTMYSHTDKTLASPDSEVPIG